MSTDVISQPSISHRGRRISLLVALAIAVAVAVAGAVVVARSSGGTSGEHAGAEPPAVASAQTSPECSVNLDYLAAEVPEGQRTRAIAVVNTLVEIAVARGEVAEARRILTGLSELKDSADVQDRTGYLTLDSTVLVDGFQWIANGGTVAVGTDPIGNPK